MKLSNILFLICLVSTLIACGGAEERKAVYLEKAKRSFEIGDFEKARIELKNVLQIDPKDAKAYFQLGRIYEGKKEYRKAFSNYSKASELDADNAEYHAKIGMFHLNLAGDVETAEKKRDIILSKDPENIYGLMLNAGILKKQGKDDEAKDITLKIFEAHPENIDNSRFLALLYTTEKDFDEAANTIRTVIARHPDNGALNSLLARLLFVSKKYEEAETVLKEILSRHPDVYSNYLNLAVLYKNTESLNKAEAILRQGINEDREDIGRKIYLIEFIRDSQSAEAAIRETQALIAQNPDVGELRIVLGKLFVKENKLDKAKETFELAMSDFSEDSTDIESRVLLAKILLRQKNIEEAKSIIEQAVIVSPNDPDVNLLKAKINLSENDIDSAIISLRIVTKDKPEDIEAYFLLSSAHKANKEDALADKVINQAYDNNRTNTSALLALTKYHIKNNNPEIAEKIIDNYLTIDGNNYEALTIKTNILARKKRFANAEPYIERLLSVFPGKENGYLQSAMSLAANDKISEAENILKEGYEKTNKNRKLLTALTKTQVYSKNFNAPVNRIKNEILQNENDVELYMLLAGVYIASKDYDAAEKTLIEAIDVDSKINRPYIVLSKLFMNRKRKNDAINILKKGLSNIDNDTAISINLAGIYELNKDYDSAIGVYENALAANQDGVVVMNNLAMLLVERSADKEDLVKAKLLADKMSTTRQPVILDTVGWVYYKTGNYTEAVSVLETVVKAMPESSIFNYHLGMALYKSGNKSQAKNYLTKALSTDEAFSGRNDAEATLKKL